MERKITRKVKVGSVYVGGDAPVSIQSMTNTDTRICRSNIKSNKRITCCRMRNNKMCCTRYDCCRSN